MPSPSRTSLMAIVPEARRILEADGLEHLTMQRVANAVGVRAPSLYKHVGSRDELIRLVAVDAIEELGRRLAAATTDDPRRDIGSMAHALRAFAHERPETYRLLWAPAAAAWRPDPDVSAKAVEPVLEVVGRLTRGSDTLEAARTLTAWAHGFVSMELAGAFRLGGDVDEAFEYGVERLTGAIAGSRRR